MKSLGRLDHEFLGSEYDWVAIDNNQAMGYFSTAGEGWIPETVLANGEAYWEILDTVLALPRIFEVKIHCTGAHYIADWVGAASHGLFAFDWNRRTKRYELVASPTDVLRLDEAGEVGILAAGTRLPCSFSSDFPDRGPT